MPEIAKAEDAGDHFTWHSWHCSGIDRKIIDQGHGLLQSHALLRAAPLLPGDIWPLWTWPCSRSPPWTSHGNFNFGLAASHLADLLVPCQVHYRGGQREYALGATACTGTEINIQDVDYVVEGDNPPVAQLGAGGEPTDVDRAVANLVVPEIPNGACLQLGIGGMPNTIGAMIAQSDLKDLVCPHRDVCGWLRGHGGRRQDHRPAQGP